MASGLLPVVRKALTTFRRLRARGLALAGAGVDLLAQLLGGGLQVEVLQALLDGFCTHTTLEVVAVAVLHLAPQVHVAFQVARLQALEAVEHGVQTLDLIVVTLADGGHVALGAVAQLGACGALALAFGLKLGEILLDLAGAVLDLVVTALGHVADLGIELVLQVGQVVVALLLIHARDHVGREVDDLLQVLGAMSSR